MGTFYSQGGSVGFRVQGSKGTYAIGGGSPARFMRIKSGALGAARDLMIPDPEIGGNRDVSDALMGPVAFKGTYTAYARMEALAVLLKGALGVANSTSTGSGPTLVGTHTIKQADTPTNIPWISVEENVGNGYENYRYTDAKVNNLKMDADAAGYLMVEAVMVALSQLAVPGASATASPGFDISPLTVGTNITLSFGGVQLPAKTFTFDINNNIEDNDFRLGSLFLGDAVEKRRLITFGAKIRPSDHNLLRQALYGDPAAVSPQGTVVKNNVVLSCQTYDFIGSTSTPYSVTLTAGKAAIKPFTPNPSGDDAIEHDIEIQVLRPDPGVDILTAVVVDDLATVV